MPTARLKPGAMYLKRLPHPRRAEVFSPTGLGPHRSWALPGLGACWTHIGHSPAALKKKSFRSEIANRAGTGFIAGLILESVHDPSAA